MSAPFRVRVIGRQNSVIHYHGGPITPLSVALATWTARHAFVSFVRPEQVALAAEVCQSFALDNGAFSVWKRGAVLDVPGYVAFVNEWQRHPACEWALAPDVIDGDEAANDAMLSRYLDALGTEYGVVPVWHLHESFDRLAVLCDAFPRVALGSSGQWAKVGTASWWTRMAAAMDAVCDDAGRPAAKLHGLRMLNPDVFSRLPLASADSTNVAQNHVRSRAQYHLTPAMGALVIVDRIERHAAASHWTPLVAQPLLDLAG